MFSRAAISFSADATSSACARLSNWHGPAMIEIGSSLPNLTLPAVTTGAAGILGFKNVFLCRRDHAGQSHRDQPTFWLSNIRVAPCAAAGGTTILPLRSEAAMPL